MGTFWSIKDAADYLGVDYKTVYRLVRQGEIPSGRVGRIYRLRKEDVDSYLERQEQPVAEPEAAPALAKCGVCLRLLTDESQVGGRCTSEGCDLPICTSCWEGEGARYCPTHRPSQQDLLARARKQLAAGEIALLVTQEEAKRRELSFMARFDEKVRRIAKLKHPLCEDVVRPPGSWDELRSHTDQSARLMELLRTGYLEEHVERSVPLNPVTRYTLPAHGAGCPGLIIEARVLSHLPAYVRQGFDTRPATLAELLQVLGDYMEPAGERNAGYLVGVASTTGWVADAIEYVQADTPGRSFFHPLVLPCLVDLHAMRLTYAEADERLAALASLFSPYLPEDQIVTVMSRIRQGVGVYGSLALGEVADEMRVSIDLVQRAAERLASADGFRIIEIEDIGLVITASAA